MICVDKRTETYFTNLLLSTNIIVTNVIVDVCFYTFRSGCVLGSGWS